ncbi:SPRY-domain-containing protein [Cylindrobasidium torrendii FP15055 ss-10]|uniref:SPRY-domain-containing protein n=1 Tax=Cylindrobasidium torrendii FP15055 ss-10 TaxID=1314674 RepID=A0A0D7B8L1_9AGAR|nr:SPRY-domain-containing protein [Cylindrobasidium torrendii FP15055 ss-10]
MSSRQPRSSSIPIPRTASSSYAGRSIEDAISMPFSSPRRHSTFRGSPDESRNGLGRSARMAYPSTSPVRPTARSYPHSSTMARSHPRPTTFEPRIVQADSTRPLDSTCSPVTVPISPRTRRTSSGRPPSINRTTSSHVHYPASHAAPIPFTRPAYLEHAALRHLLQADSPSQLPPLRKPEPAYSRYGAPSPSIDSDEDSATASPMDMSPPPQPLPSPDTILQLPTRWSDCRHQSLNVSSDGRELMFQGASNGGDRDGHAGAARTDHPIPPACGIYYYEVEVRSKSSSAHISIGLAGPDVALNRLPGWEHDSWGYHGDDGRSFASERDGTLFGPTYGSGDIVGCGLDYTDGRVFFTKNGNLIGHVFSNVGRTLRVYPSVGLKHTNDGVHLNVGQEPFKYDIEGHVQARRQAAWQTVMDQPVHLTVGNEESGAETMMVDGMAEDETKRSLNRLVMSYLSHHGYSKTLRALQKDTHRDPAGDRMETDSGEDFDARTRIVQHVMNGRLDDAIGETRTRYPGVFEAEEGIMLFKLRCRKFVELVMETVELKKALKARTTTPAKVEEDLVMTDGMDVDGPGDAAMDETEAALNSAIAYGQALANDYRHDERAEVKTVFMKTFGILAFEDPRKEPSVADVVGQDEKIALANELNQAILRSQGRPPQPALEMFYRHTGACMQHLALLGVGIAPFVDVKREFLEG